MANPRNEEAFKSREINALLEISKAITSGVYLEDVLRQIVTVTANLMDSKICSLWILDEKDQKLKLKATQSMSEEYLKERRLGLGEGVVGHVALHNQPLSILDVLKEPLYKEKELARREGLVSMLSVPMCIKNRVIGVINCYTSYPHPFSKTEEEILTTVANQAAARIENAGLMETLDVDEILRLVLEGVTKNFGFDRARLYMMNEKKNLLECRMAVGIDQDDIKGIALPLDPKQSIVARSVFERKPYVVSNAKQDPRVNAVLKEKFDLHSLLVVPILAREKALGAIAADHAKSGRRIAQQTLESVVTLAQQAGLAIHSAFMYEELKTFSQQMEERFQKTTADLRRTEAQLIRSEKLAALGQLAAGLAHEIRNPLTSINILIQSLREKPFDGKHHRQDLMVVEEEIQRINEIVDQFLQFARPALPLFKRAAIATLFDETLLLLKPQIERQGISVHQDFSPLPPILMDPDQMKQVILNLLLNAIQAMPKGGRLTMGAQLFEDNRWVQLSIQDTGVGISPENLRRLFDPFFTTKESGLGLGLSIAHRIVDQHHGRMEVESQPDRGTLFRIWLPFAQEEQNGNRPHR